MMAFLKLIPGANYLVAAFEFATSKIGIAIIFLVAGLATGYGWSNDNAKIDNLKAEIATLKIDVSIARNSEALAKSQELWMGALAKTNQEKASALQRDLAARAQERRACALSESDVGRLRDIR
jgi:hypothetical protein